MSKLNLKEISKQVKKYFCLKELGLDIEVVEEKGKLAIYPTTYSQKIKDSENNIKKAFLSIPHIALYKEKIFIERSQNKKQEKERYILSIDLPQELFKDDKIIIQIKNTLSYYSAITGYEINLEKQSNGFIIKKFETHEIQILQGICFSICIFKEIYKLYKEIFRKC